MLLKSNDFANTVEIDYDKPYNPKAQSLEFFSWVNATLPKEDTPTPKIHYAMIDVLLSKKTEVEAVCHREAAKSTVATKFIPLSIIETGHLINFGKVTNMAIFSATYKQAVLLLASIVAAIESSERLREGISIAKKSNGKNVADRGNQICYVNRFGHIVNIFAFGANDAIRGTKISDENGIDKRLQVLFFDDILPEDILTSEKEREKQLNWLVSAVTPAMDTSHNKSITVGTFMHQDDIIYRLLKSKECYSIFLPLMKEFKKEGTTSWPTLHSMGRVWKKYKKAKSIGGEDSWRREYLLELASEKMRVFKKQNNRTVKYKDIKDKLHTMNIFTTIDVAISKKKTAAKSAIMTIAIDGDSNRYVLLASSGRMNPDQVIDMLFEHVRLFNPLEVRAEKATIQQVYNHYIDKEMEKRKIFFNFEDLTSNNEESKHARIIGISPLHRRGKIIICSGEEQKEGRLELEEQMAGYLKTGATTPTIDTLDCLANFNDKDFIYSPMENYGSEIMGEDEEDYEVIKYL